MAVAILDSWSTQTSTQDLSFTVSSGTDRLLLACVATEDNSSTNVTSMTYGGQTMFLVSNGTTTAKGSNTGGGSDSFLEIWGCLETEIAAASGTTIDVTMDNGSISQYLISAGSYEGVDQSGNGSSGSVDDVGVLTTGNTTYSFVSGDNIQVTADGLAVMCCVSRTSSTFTSTAPLTEIFDFTTGSASSGGGDDLITSTDSAYTSTITATSNNRGVGVIVTFAAGAASFSADLTDATFDLTAQDLDQQADRVSDLSTSSFSFTPQALTVNVDYTGDLTPASLGFTTQDLTLLSEYNSDLTTASFNFTSQDLMILGDYVASLSAVDFKFLGQSLTYTIGFSVNLNSPSFSFIVQPLTFTAEFIGDLTAPTFNFIGQDLDLNAGSLVGLASPSFVFTAQALDQQADSLQELTSATFIFTSQALDILNDYSVNLIEPTFTFTAQDLDVVEEGAQDLTTAIFTLTAQDLDVIASGAPATTEDGLLGIMLLHVKGPVKDLINKRNR